MKKIIFLFLTAFTLTASAQTINLTANKWYVTFSADLKTAYLNSNNSGNGDERQFSFSAADATMTESGISSAPLAKFKWIYKVWTNPNNFSLYQKDLQWVFDFM